MTFNYAFFKDSISVTSRRRRVITKDCNGALFTVGNIICASGSRKLAGWIGWSVLGALLKTKYEFEALPAIVAMHFSHSLVRCGY